MQKEKMYYGLGAGIIVIIAIGYIRHQPQVTNYSVISSSSTVNSEVSESNSEIFVQVTGAVDNPGLYQMESGQRINDLLLIAGGEDYNSSCINLAQKLVDEQNLYIPASGEPCVEEISVSENGIVNINTASSLELQSLPGIGEAKANAIVEYRAANGTFESISELLNVDGISEGLLQSISADISLS